MNRNTGRAALISILVVIPLLAGVYFSGVGRGKAPEYVGPAAEVSGSRDQFSSDIKAIIALSNSKTREASVTFDGDQGKRESLPARVPLHATPSVDTAIPWSPLDPAMDFAPGELLFSTESLPSALVPWPGHGIVYTKNGGLVHWENGKESPLADVDAEFLQWNAGGDRLLAQARDRVVIFSGSKLEEPEEIHHHPEGRAFWNADDSLLFVHETISMDANEESRIQLDLAGYDVDSGRASAAPWEVLGRYAAVGTLPGTGKVWAQLTQKYQVDPMPAPLLSISNGTVEGFMTRTDDAADISPAMTSDGTLVWIRTWRRSSPTGRLYMKGVGDKNDNPLTARPTWQVSAASSEIVYTSTNPDGLFEVRLLEQSTLDQAAALGKQAFQADQAFRESARKLQRDLRVALLQTSFARSVETKGSSWTLKAVPQPGIISEMGTKLSALIQKDLGIPIAGGVAGLGDLDGALKQASPYIQEEPAMILGIAGILANALPASGQWALDDAGTSLSSDVQESWQTDGLTYMAIEPFGAAREALAGRLSLAALSGVAFQNKELPLFYVENFRQDTLRGLQLRQWKETGLPMDNFDARALGTYLDTHPEASNVVLQIAAEIGPRNGLTEMALKASMRLAQRAPASATALGQLASTLSGSGYTPEAIIVYQEAVLIAPLDASLRMELADALAISGDTKGAAVQYETARRTDRTGAMGEEIDSRLQMLNTLKE